LVHAGKIQTADKLKTDTLHKLNTTQRKANNAKYSITKLPSWFSRLVYDTRPGNEVGLFYKAPEPTRAYTNNTSLLYNQRLIYKLISHSLSIFVGCFSLSQLHSIRRSIFLILFLKSGCRQRRTAKWSGRGTEGSEGVRWRKERGIKQKRGRIKCANDVEEGRANTEKRGRKEWKKGRNTIAVIFWRRKE